VCLIEILRQVADGLVAGCRVGDARVEVVEFDSEGFAAFEVVDEAVVRLLSPGGVCVCQVDQVASVRHDMLILLIIMMFALGVEALGGISQQGRVDPFSLRFEEQSECICSNMDRVQWCILYA
jgi:hypothetical protein